MKGDERMLLAKLLNSKKLKYVFIALVIGLNSYSYIWADESGAAELPSEDIQIIQNIYDNPRDFEREQGALAKADTNIISVVNPESIQEVKGTWGRSLANLRQKMTLLEFPTKQLRRHFSEQLSFYENDKTALLVLTVLVGSTAVNWFVFADQYTLATKSFLLGMNSLVYAYLVVNVKNWQRLLTKSEQAVEYLRKHKKLKNVRPELDKSISTLTTNFAFFMLYNFSIQGVIHWSDINQLFGRDVINFVLTNSMLGLLSSGVWDTAFRKWYTEGRVNARGLSKLVWVESLAMVTLNTFISMGYTAGYIGIATHGTLGALSILVTSKKYSSKLKSYRQKVKWGFERGRAIVSSFNAPLSSASTGGGRMCRGYLQ